MAQTLAGKSVSELLLKKSRFLGAVQPVQNREEALREVQALRQAHPLATHVCWALMAGGHSAAHDDGEPGGTAGRPMLEVLRHQELEGVLATVVRYYGGVKLGAGGLLRAYTEAIVQALKDAERLPIVSFCACDVMIPYALEGSVRRLVERIGGSIEDVQHDDAVRLSVRLSAPAYPQFSEELMDLTAGRAEIKRIP